MAHVLEVGGRVRVYDPATDRASTAVISVISSDQPGCEGTVDVIYDAGDSPEEANIPLSRIQPLQAFEEDVQRGVIFESSQYKDFGNVLFGSKDYAAAMLYYQKALRAIDQRQRLSTGSHVIFIDPQCGECKDGIISGEDESKEKDGEVLYEVLLGDEEEVTTRPEHLVQIPSDLDQCLLQRSVYLNLARCCLKRALKGWAIRYGSIALGITRDLASDHSDSADIDLNKLFADALYFRAKTMILASRSALASKVSRPVTAVIYAGRPEMDD